MRIALVAMTTVLPGSMRTAGWVDSYEQKAYAINDSDLLAEFAGRLCYRSWSRPNPATATNEGYLAHIIESGHFSVLEHASFSFYAEGVSRSLLAELTRHRHLSFSVLSQRYVNHEAAEMIYPPALTEPRQRAALDVIAEHARRTYANLSADLRALGLSRKQAREAARCVMPQATETRFIVTGNVRAWREVIVKRDHPAADAEIQVFARDILRLLKVAAPNSFQDMDVECDDRDTDDTTVTRADGGAAPGGLARDASDVAAGGE